MPLAQLEGKRATQEAGGLGKRVPSVRGIVLVILCALKHWLDIVLALAVVANEFAEGNCADALTRLSSAKCGGCVCEDAYINVPDSFGDVTISVHNFPFFLLH